MNFAELVSIHPYEWSSVLASLFCGAIIGLERQLRGKPVGIRTATLIVLGTYLFLNTSLLLQGPSVDQTRVIGQIVTGIGFLGAGVMLARDGSVVGVTSASAIWVLAALGVVISTGHLIAAMKLSILVVVILTGIDWLETNTKAFSLGVHSRVLKYSRRQDDKDETQ